MCSATKNKSGGSSLRPPEIVFPSTLPGPHRRASSVVGDPGPAPDRSSESAAVDLGAADLLEPEGASEMVEHPLAVDRAAAEQVDRDQPLLRPGVDGQMRLGE